MIDSIRHWGELGPVPLSDILLALATAAFAVTVAVVAHRLLFAVLKRVAKSSNSDADNLIVTTLAKPTLWAFIALGIVLAAREIALLEDVWVKIAGFVMPALIGWIALSIMRATIKAMELRADISVPDNLRARRYRTRLAIFSRIGTFLIIFLTVGLMLLSIPGVRDIGATLLASAGLAALAVGAAAQPALKALIGGLQLALTEPIRIDDVVIVDGEWGKIEDIRTTYVVVKVWDERRLVVPVSKFLDETFQNWTRNKSELLGTVFLHLDPTADIARIRIEFERQIEANPLWDGRVKVVQVTDTTLDSIEVRLLMSAKDAPTAFDLRCQMREAMLAFVRDSMPGAIARRRFRSIDTIGEMKGE